MTGRFDSASGREAALTRWAFEEDPVAATAPARRGFADRFAREVDPDGLLPAAERERRADRLMRAYMSRLARSKKKRPLRAV
jgi:hypothetical protein